MTLPPLTPDAVRAMSLIATYPAHAYSWTTYSERTTPTYWAGVYFTVRDEAEKFVRLIGDRYGVKEEDVERIYHYQARDRQGRPQGDPSYFFIGLRRHD